MTKGKPIDQLSSPPEVKLRSRVEDHLLSGDALLLAALDVAERGRQESSGSDRFHIIVELLNLYRKGHSNFIDRLYKADRPKPKAA